MYRVGHPDVSVKGSSERSAWTNQRYRVDDSMDQLPAMALRILEHKVWSRKMIVTCGSKTSLTGISCPSLCVPAMLVEFFVQLRSDSIELRSVVIS